MRITDEKYIWDTHMRYRYEIMIYLRYMNDLQILLADASEGVPPLDPQVELLAGLLQVWVIPEVSRADTLSEFVLVRDVDHSLVIYPATVLHNLPCGMMIYIIQYLLNYIMKWIYLSFPNKITLIVRSERSLHFFRSIELGCLDRWHIFTYTNTYIYRYNNCLFLYYRQILLVRGRRWLHYSYRLLWPFWAPPWRSACWRLCSSPPSSTRRSWCGSPGRGLQ